MKGFVYDGMPVDAIHIALIVACGVFVVAAIIGAVLGWDRKGVFVTVISIILLPTVLAFVAGAASSGEKKAINAYSDSVIAHVEKTAGITVTTGDIGVEPEQLYMMNVKVDEYESVCGVTMPKEAGGDLKFQCGDEGVGLDKAKKTIIAEEKAKAEAEAAEKAEEEKAAADAKK